MDSLEAGPSGMTRYMSRKDLYAIVESSNEPTFAKKLDFMGEKVLNMYDEDHEKQKEVKRKLSLIKHQFKERWLAAHKKKHIFEKNNSDWLNSMSSLALPITAAGRPEKAFVDLSDRSKQRKTELRSNEEEDLLNYAAQMKLSDSGNTEASSVVKDLEEPLRQLSPLAALSMYLDAGLTRSQYEIVRSTNKEFFPRYSILQKAKQDCCPPKESLNVTETSAEVDLQSLLDHTVSRLILSLEDAIDTLKIDEKNSLELICNWGCVGSTQMQMNFDNETDIFQSFVVPLKLVCGNEKRVIWENPTPSSPRCRRPIRIRFVRETTAIINEEIDYIQSKINSLQPTDVEGTKIKHTLLFTMVTSDLLLSEEPDSSAEPESDEEDTDQE